MNTLYRPAVIFLVALILISFFLPWVRVESGAVGVFSKVLTGEKQAVIDAISAFRVPILANGENSRLMLSVISIFYPKVENADKKSYLVWGVPILALAILFVSFAFGKNKWANLLIGAIGCTVFFFAVYKIKTTNLNKMVLNVTMAPGLWLTLWAYLLLGVAGIVEFGRQALKKS